MKIEKYSEISVLKCDKCGAGMLKIARTTIDKLLGVRHRYLCPACGDVFKI